MKYGGKRLKRGMVYSFYLIWHNFLLSVYYSIGLSDKVRYLKHNKNIIFVSKVGKGGFHEYK